MKFTLKPRHYWIAGLIGAISLTGAYMYIQVKKILSYTLNWVGVRDVKITTTDISMNFIYEYENKANIDVTLFEQEYEVFINGIYYTTLTNKAPQTLFGGKKSYIAVNLLLNYKEVAAKLKVNYLTLLTFPQNIKLLTKMKWKVKYGIIKIPITYPYEVTLKEVIGWYIPQKTQ